MSFSECARLDWDSLSEPEAMNRLSHSLRDCGSVLIRRPPLPADARELLVRAQADLFALSDAAKKRGEPKAGPSVTGYIPFAVERAGAGDPPDPKEAWHISVSGQWPNYFPPEVPELRRATEALRPALEKFGAELLAKIGGQENRENEYAALMNGNDSILRLVRYAPGPAGKALAGVHCDVGLLTVILHQSHSGYETFTAGRWQPVETREDEVLITAGQMLEFISGGSIRAPRHRVRAPNGLDSGRFFAGYFVHPAPDAVLRSSSAAVLSKEILEKRFADMDVARRYPY